MAFIVLGNVTVDEAMAAPVWPTPGQTVVVGSPCRDLGGKGANQALVLKRAGAEVQFVAAIGSDGIAAWIVEALRADGFRAEDLIPLPMPSDRSLIFIGPDGENAIASITGCSAAITPEDAVAALRGTEADDVLVLQGNLSLAATEAACLEARRRGQRIAFNPSPTHSGFAALLPMIDLLVVNESEATQLGGAGRPEDQLRALQAAGAATVVLTLGGRGSKAFGTRGAAEVPAEAVKAIDTTGAGDTYTGVLAAALYGRNLTIGAAVRAASAAAAITVGRRGTWSAFPTAPEIAAIFARP